MRVMKVSPDHPIIGEECPACDHPFTEGQEIVMKPLGPGDDEEEREHCREGRPYNAVASVLHRACSDYDRQR